MSNNNETVKNRSKKKYKYLKNEQRDFYVLSFDNEISSSSESLAASDEENETESDGEVVQNSFNGFEEIKEEPDEVVDDHDDVDEVVCHEDDDDDDHEDG